MISEGSILYYIEDYSDEIMPCAPTLDGWAEWLAKPIEEEWGRDGVTADGASFSASVMRIEADIVAQRQSDGGWSFSRDPAGADFLAVRWSEGFGWDADNIIGGTDMCEALRDWLTNQDYEGGHDDVEYVAVGTNLPDVTLVFNAGPPPSMTVREQATVQ